jgi:hypothetical protein
MTGIKLNIKSWNDLILTFISKKGNCLILKINILYKIVIYLGITLIIIVLKLLLIINCF